MDALNTGLPILPLSGHPTPCLREQAGEQSGFTPLLFAPRQTTSPPRLNARRAWGTINPPAKTLSAPGDWLIIGQATTKTTRRRSLGRAGPHSGWPRTAPLEPVSTAELFFTAD